jgi:hypothetical protein
MNKFFLIFLISFGIVGCSSLELGDAMSSQQYTQKILDLGLSHEDNLAEARKLKTPHLISVVSLQLTNARDEKIQNEIDLIESEKFADKVTVSGSRYIGSEISESIKTGVLETDFDLLNYFLEGVKDSKSGNIQHKLHMTVSHNSKSKREYLSAHICNQWGSCDATKEDGSNNKLELIPISTNASNCNSFKCDYSESIELSLSDDFLRDSADKGISLSLISKKKSHKIKVSKPYLMGYLAKAI